MNGVQVINPTGPVEVHRPRLRGIDLLWRFAVSVGISVAITYHQLRPTDFGPETIIVTWGLAVAAFTLVLIRRRRPLLTALLTGLCSVFSPMAVGAFVWAIFALATTRRWRQYVVVGVIAAAVGIGTALVPFDLWVQRIYPIRADGSVLTSRTVLTAVTAVPQTVGIWMLVIGIWGGQVGAQRALLSELRRRTAQAEDERDLRIAQARSSERERIAREMHDGLAHRISQISVHAGALAYRPDLAPQRVAAAAATIQHGSRQALLELRDVLGVLRGVDGRTDGAAPQPMATAADLDQLIGSCRATGQPISTAIDAAALVDLALPVSRAIDRIIQEGLTNAGRHAAGQPVDISVTRSPAAVEISVSNPIDPCADDPLSTAPESGFGIVGLTERVELLAGTLAVVRSATRFSLQARLPVAP